ncbi:MAG: beta-ketoacyl-ACP synthase 3 [Burkholderiales bacterium]|nr:beta-ketoacyl-ACP synthase 3 [Burkholderiales bacterium]
MTRAAITGWGKCMPPAVLSNHDLATFLDTDDAWIAQRTGIRERRITHVLGSELSYVAARRALACAALAARDLDLVVYGSCSAEEAVPNTASGLQYKLGAWRAGAMDVNTACTSFLYGLSSAAGMIATGTIRSALVVGVETISPFLDWDNRGVAVLFGDGCAAVVLQAAEHDDEGLLADKLGCYADSRQILRVRGHGTTYGNRGISYGDTLWDFDGQEIFKRAVHGMSEAAADVLVRAGRAPADVHLVVPHQANLRIIEFVAKRAGIPMDRVFLTVHKYGNMSAATVPVALVEALEAGAVPPRALMLMPAFGAGLTWCAHLLRFGERVTPLDAADVELPPCERTALQMVNELRARKETRGRSAAGLVSPVFPETQVVLAGGTGVA